MKVSPASQLSVLPTAAILAAMPVTAHAAQPSFLYEAYSAGVTPWIHVGMTAFGVGRVLGGVALSHALSQCLKTRGFDVERFEGTRPRTRNALPLVAGVVAATAFATNLYAGEHNFEFATLSALTGTAVLAGEALYFAVRTARAYFASQRKLVTETERATAVARYKPLVESQAKVLAEQLSSLRSQFENQPPIVQIKDGEVWRIKIEGVEAEIILLHALLEDLGKELYADVFASHRGDLERYFEELRESPRQDVSSGKQPQQTMEGQP